MSKRSSDAADQPHAKAATNGRAPRVDEEDEGMGEFEDRWEDEIESEDEEDGQAGNGVEGDDDEDEEGE